MLPPFCYTIIFIIALRFAYILIIWFLHGTVNKNCVNTQALHTFNIGFAYPAGAQEGRHLRFPPSCESPLSLWDSLAENRRAAIRFEKGERQRIFSSVGEHSVLPFLYLCAVPDTLLLHIPATLRRRNITVLRNSFARCYGRHLRIVSDVRLYRRVRRLGAPYQTTCTRVTVGAVIGRPRNRKSSRQFSILHYSTA